MKKFFFALCLAVGAAGAVHAQDAAKPNPKAPKFQFASETHDFGTVKEGPVAEYVFTFKNAGKEPLLIQNASASCGCTTPEWPKEPIKPNGTGKITVRYNTQGRVGPFEKSVYISSNAVNPEGRDRYELKIKGTVAAANAQ